jgi:hypothetical protein
VADENSLMMIVYQGNNYQIRVGDLLSVAGVPTTRQVIAGTGMTGGGQLTSNVTLSVASKAINGTLLSDTGVASGVYGNATNIPVFTVDSTGRVTAATTIPATISGYVPTSTQVIAGNGLTGGGALNDNVTLAANFSSTLPQAGFQTGSVGVANTLSRGDHKHPAVDLSADDQVDNILGLGNGGTARSLVAAAGAVIWSGADGLYVGPVGQVGQVLLSGNTGAPTWASQDELDVGQANNLNGGAANRIAYQSATDVTSFIEAPLFTGTLLKWNGTGFEWGTVTGAGTVTSVGLAMPSQFAVTGTPVTSAGVLTAAWNAQAANSVLSGPTTGANAVPTFRALVNDDLPSTLTGKTISGSANTLNNIGNASLVNSAITINGTAVSLGGSTSITPASIGAVSSVSGTANEVTATTVGTAVTVSLPSALTFTGKTVTNGTYANPAITGTVKLTGTGAAAYTPFVQTFSSAVSNFNGYQLNYIQNTNNGSDASVDYVAYNDASDVDSYFIDMGIVSSNYSSVLNTVFPANSGYVYTGGGTSGQAAPLLFGTSNSASDITFFTGGTLLANTRATIKGNTGNVLIGTTTDTGYQFNVNGTTYFGGASTFGSTVLLNANPTLALQAVTKQYVDSAVATGFVVHPAVRAATPTGQNLGVIYNNGTAGVGATITADTNRAFTAIDGVAGWSVGQRFLVKDQTSSFQNGVYTLTNLGSAGVSPWVATRATDFDTAAAGEVANNAYFFVTSGTTNAGSSWVLNQLAAITVGTTALPFDLFASGLVYTGGTNIDVTGQVISLTGTVAATNGGTGTSTVTTGDLLYGSATNTWSKLPLGVAYKSLVINASGTQVEWNAVPLNQTAAVSGTLGTANGGTGLSSYTSGGVVYASSTSALATGSAMQFDGSNLTVSGTITAVAGINGGTF